MVIIYLVPGTPQEEGGWKLIEKFVVKGLWTSGQKSFMSAQSSRVWSQKNPLQIGSRSTTSTTVSRAWSTIVRLDKCQCPWREVGQEVGMNWGKTPSLSRMETRLHCCQTLCWSSWSEQARMIHPHRQVCLLANSFCFILPKKKGSSSQGHRLESQLVLKYH